MLHRTIWYTSLEVRRNGVEIIVVCHFAEILVPKMHAERS